jgi:hypothetical protein
MRRLALAALLLLGSLSAATPQEGFPIGPAVGNATGNAALTTIGSWTPADNSGASLVFTGVSANYTRIGNIVIAYAQFTYPSTADGSSAGISGLPITATNSPFAQSGCVVTFTNAAANKQALLPQNTQTVAFYAPNSATRATNAQLSTAQVNLTCTYPAT